MGKRHIASGAAGACISHTSLPLSTLALARDCTRLDAYSRAPRPRPTSPAHPRSSHPAQSLHPIQEHRQAPDGNYYTAGEFLEHYRQYKEWDNAIPQHPPLTTQTSDSHNSETKPTQAPKTGVDTTHSLFHTLAHPSRPADTRWHIGQRLLVRWGATSTLCTVRSIHADGRYVVQYDQGGSWGDTERRVPSARLHKPPPTCEVL